MQDSLTSSFRWGETFDTAPLCQRLQHLDFNGDGRTDRASLQGDVGGRSNALTGTDAQIVRSYRATWGDGVML